MFPPIEHLTKEWLRVYIIHTDSMVATLIEINTYRIEQLNLKNTRKKRKIEF